MPHSPAKHKHNDTVNYAAHGVGEYWIVDPDGETVEKFVLQAACYAKARRQKSDVIASDVVAGFRIPVRAIFDGRANFVASGRVLIFVCLKSLGWFMGSFH